MKKEANAIEAYWEEIQTGGVTVGKWIRQLYEVILKGIDEGRWRRPGPSARARNSEMIQIIHGEYATWCVFTVDLFYRCRVSLRRTTASAASRTRNRNRRPQKL